jgi:hypothetical protein
LGQRLEVERFGAAAGQVRAQNLVHDRDDDAAVAVGGQEVEVDKVVDERRPVAVGEVDGGRHHGLPVGGGHLSDEAKVQQAQLAGVGAGRDFEEVA